VKAFYCANNALLARLREVAGKALAHFPEIIEVHFIGSLAKGTETGPSVTDYRS
jgi:hypothetical protein